MADGPKAAVISVQIFMTPFRRHDMLVHTRDQPCLTDDERRGSIAGNIQQHVLGPFI